MSATTKTDDQTENKTTEAELEESEEKAEAAEAADDEVEDDDVVEDLAPPAKPRTGVAAGAASIAGAGLGLLSLTGTWMADTMAARKELIGQIKTSAQGQSGGNPADQIADVYATPWHTTALFNGTFALVAVLVSAFVLLRPVIAGGREQPVTWVRSVAVAGLVLGVLGLIIAGGMYFDLFASVPSVPSS
ncbi:hypothetical protein G5C51_08895 [Streptomyces sp. A7024]|uniref:Uncharacterized protein n=1 Tax=Streptomyces coryli TaxID=1128680 RepID=A0A6G4TYF0_9ACTN|nr:hypothetical protein [Streptomyces coryli]NGN64021.1 hypothetical protein [Streptomyces coryli]